MWGEKRQEVPAVSLVVERGHLGAGGGDESACTGSKGGCGLASCQEDILRGGVSCLWGSSDGALLGIRL